MLRRSRTWVLLVGFVVAAIGVSGCATRSVSGSPTFAGTLPPSASGAPGTPPPQEIVAGLGGRPQNFNPYTGDGESPETGDVIAGLFPSAFVQLPSYEYRINGDLLQQADSRRINGKQVVEYVIADDARWSDGTPITVDDFRYLWQRSRSGPPGLFLGYDRIANVRRRGTDRKDVLVTFSQPDSEWQRLFHPLLPSHYLKQHGWHGGLAHDVPVSAGPFRMDSATASRIVLVRDEKYFGTRAKLRKLTFRPLPDPAVLAPSVAAGHVDVAVIDDPTPGGSSAGVHTTISPTGGYGDLELNTRSGPSSDARVRRAVALALDRRQISRVGAPLASGPVPGNRLLAVGAPGYQDHAPKQDRARARSLLQQAGYHRAGSTMTKKGTALTLKLVVPAGDQSLRQVAMVVADQLRRIGVEVTIPSVDQTLFYGTVLPKGMFDLALSGLTFSQPGVETALSFACSGSDNPTHYCSRKVDGLLRTASHASSPSAAEDSLNAADRRMWQDVPTIPLYEHVVTVLTGQDVSGVTYDPGERTVFWNAASWTVH